MTPKPTRTMKVNEAERWAMIPGISDRYRVSDAGNVRLLTKTGVWRPIRPFYLKEGCLYQGVAVITSEGKWTVGAIHRLVLFAFRGLPPPGMEGRHLDSNSLNNRLSNLAWGTHKENVGDNVRRGVHPHGEKMWASRLTNNEVFQMRVIYATTNLSQERLGRVFGGMPQSAVGRIMRREAWKHVIEPPIITAIIRAKLAANLCRPVGLASKGRRKG